MRRIIGSILVAAGLVLAVVLFMSGTLIFPHVAGPIILAAIGAVLLAARGGADRQAK